MLLTARLRHPTAAYLNIFFCPHFRQVESAAEVVGIVQHGMLHRHEDATFVHAHSSRSHLIVTLTVTTYPRGAPTTTPNASRSASPVAELPSPGKTKQKNTRKA